VVRPPEQSGDPADDVTDDTGDERAAARPTVPVVLVHWNQAARCRESIRAFLAQDVHVEIVVVDNASRPEELALLEAIVDEANEGAAGATPGGPVRLIALGDNRGFGPAANVGLRTILEAGPAPAPDDDWIGLAPHDALPAPGTLRSIVEAAGAQAHAGLACADVGDGETPVIDPYFGGMTKPAERDQGWEDAGYPHGTLLLARRACLEDIGLFDERYFAYCEEADLGWRATRAGWQVGLVRGARVVNPATISATPVAEYLMLRNTLLLVRDHSGAYHAFIRLVIAAMQLTRGLVQPSSRSWRFDARGRARGMVDFVRGRFGPPPSSLLDGTESKASASLDPTPA
jgi:GT2 family glycosyltransferase